MAVALVLVCIAVTVVVARVVGDATERRASSEEATSSRVSDTPSPSTEASVPSTSTTAPATTVAPVCDRRPELDGGAEAPPPEWIARLEEHARGSWGGVERSISVWVEGYGEVLAVEPDAALLPASNQKLFTAIGAGQLLDPEQRFRTEVRRSGATLHLVAGGDPTLRSVGPHSLAALAEQVRAAGVERVDGVVVDASRFEDATSAEGWQDWQIPTYVGPLSALTVDDNRGRADPAFLTDPALANGESFVAALRRAGVRVDGGASRGLADATAPTVAALDSATVAELVDVMLTASDNENAEALLRLMGEGATADGAARIAASIEPWCLHLEGAASDGSGLSREDRRSAREWRRMLQVAAEQPWSEDLWSGLPVAGRSGTLRGRLAGPATAGVVAAKTGSIIGGSALSGYARTTDGRSVVFSVIVNGEPGAAAAAVAQIDRLVTLVVQG